MSRIDHSIQARDTTADGDFNDVVLTDEPISQSELEELLYSDAFSRDARLEKLRELRETLRGRESADLGGDDPGALIAEIDRSIAELEAGGGESMNADAVDHNPEDHSETMSPDSDEYLDRMEKEEASLDESGTKPDPLDEAEWDDGDGFDPSKGVG